MRLAILALVVSGSLAFADETTLRIGTVAPDGTGWARGLRAMAREVEDGTGGSLHLKFYFGGIAGDEMDMLERVRRGQLDGVLSGSSACETVAPSLRVLRLPGVLQTWNETAYALGKLRTVFEDEAKRNGFTYLAEAIVGPSIAFTRAPVHNVAELRGQRMWLWDIDRMLGAFLPDMGLSVVPLPIRDALHAYEESRVDGFFGPAVVALAFQWSTAARYYTDLRMGFIASCFIVANHTFDALPLPTQQTLRVAAAHAKAHFEDIGRAQEEQLMHGLFEKQGLQPVHVDEVARVSFFEAARMARDKSVQKLLPEGILSRLLTLLADYRSEHR